MQVQCNLIIDSCCDLPLEMVQIEGIDLLCFNYILDGESYKDDFYQSRTPHDFYEIIRQGGMPSTSQSSPADIEAAFRRAAKADFLRYTFVFPADYQAIIPPPKHYYLR